MSGDCDKCGEHALECVCCKNEDPTPPWKPNPSELCPLCEDNLYISSIIPQNGQVNFGCFNKKCPVTGFVYNGNLYFNDGT
jgi:hypothetical protein